MNFISKYLLTGFLMLISVLPVAGQVNDFQTTDEDSTFFDTMPANYMSQDFMESIPPLSVLIDAAEVNSPLLAHNAAEISIYQRQIRTERKRLLETIMLETSFKYGMFDNFYIAENPAEALTDSYLSTSEQFRYSAGISVRLPIMNFADRRNQIKIAKLRHDQWEYRLEENKQALRQAIIAQYYELASSHSVLLLRNQEVVSTEVQVLMAENQFKNGEITTEQLTRYKSTHTKARIDLEVAKGDLISKYLILQDITGITF